MKDLVLLGVVRVVAEELVVWARVAAFDNVEEF
jgi:hypothetical protein